MRKLLLSLFAILLSCNLYADEATIDGIRYYLNSETNEATVMGGGYSGNVVIPSSVVYSDNTYSVTRIDLWAFSRCTGLKSIDIPNSVTSIGGEAFKGCTGLTSIVLPNSVTTIESSAFSGCSSLVSIEIPSSITSIGWYVFDGTAWYENQPDGVVYAGKIAYIYKGTMPQNTSVVIKEGTTQISDWAFNDCSGLISIEIPSSVTRIGEYAFQSCVGLTSIDIPDNVTSIGEGAFQNCRELASINIPQNVSSIGHTAFNNTAWFNNQPDGLVYTGNIAYEYKGKMPKNTSVIIKDGTTKISDYAFSGCSNLVSVEIPNSVTNIGSFVFYRCKGLTSIGIPNNVELINSYAFADCDELKSVTLGSSVKKIANRAFENDKIVSITSLSVVPPSITEYTFANDVYDNAELRVPVNSYIAYINDKVWQKFANMVIIDPPVPNALYINAKNFPDPKFRHFLLNESFGKDGIITEEEISGITTLDVSNQEISDLTGVEHFTALKKLFCYGNNLNGLDLSANKFLTEVDCYSNHILGAKMDALLASLPTLNEDEGSLYVLDTTDDGNICFAEQVSFAKSKGWIVYYYTGSDWQEYEGREPGILIAEENFPDEFFRKYLMEQDYGKDMIITDDEIKEITSINVVDYSYSSWTYIGEIKTLEGIEHFTSLKKLACTGNKLTSLDVSKNTELTELDCGYNLLTSLDLSNNTALTSVYCVCNQLTSLDLSKNDKLINLSCHHNKILNLDFSKNRDLIWLHCADNQLTDIDISKNTALTFVYCAYNQLASLDISKNNALEELACMGNQLTKLDVSKNPMLKTLKCQGNKINGGRMDQLIGGLPIKESALLCVIDTYFPEENICTQNQVKEANEKGWKVMCGSDFWNSGPDHYRPDYHEYEGSDPSYIETITLTNDANISIYDINGIKLKYPRKGLNIIGGKKIIIK